MNLIIPVVIGIIFMFILISIGSKKYESVDKDYVIDEDEVDEHTKPYFILKAMNYERDKVGLPPLVHDGETRYLSDRRISEIIEDGTFSHELMGDERAKLLLLGADFVGENLAIGYTHIPSLIKSWMVSEGHRKNILSPNYQWCGISIGITREGHPLYCVLFGGEKL